MKTNKLLVNALTFISQPLREIAFLLYNNIEVTRCATQYFYIKSDSSLLKDDC